MSQHDPTQEALDEYYTTGVDPTGGEIGPDFDPETGEYIDDLDEEEVAFYREEKAHPWAGVRRPKTQRPAADEKEAQKQAENRWMLILFLGLILLAILAAIF